MSKKFLPPQRTHKKETVKKEDARANVSFLAFFTHDPATQPKLPQIFVGDKRKFTIKLLNEVAPHVPEGFCLWREDSSWNNHAIMKKAMKELCSNLKDHAATHQIILVLDSARCHLHSSICHLATRLGIRLVYVPAKLTWLLQPADTHAFSRLKRRLRRMWLDLCVKSSSGEVSRSAWLSALLDVTRKLFCEVCWHDALENDGLLDETKVSRRILNELGWAEAKPVSASILTQDQLSGVLPKRTKMARDAMFKWAMPKAVPTPKPEPKANAKAKAVPEGPIASRTRKKKAVSLD